MQDKAARQGLASSSPRMLSGSNPIDHIFQFHKALRRDLLRLEADAARFSAAVHAADAATPIAKVWQPLTRQSVLWLHHALASSCAGYASAGCLVQCCLRLPSS